MQRDIKDMARLWDILDAARTAVEFTKEVRYQDFLNDRKTRNAVERNLEIIGEAAKHVSQETRDAHPEIPRSSIIALRNIIAREYGEILYEKVWRICQNRLPSLIERLIAIGVDSAPSIEDVQKR